MDDPDRGALARSGAIAGEGGRIPSAPATTGSTAGNGASLDASSHAPVVADQKNGKRRRRRRRRKGGSAAASPSQAPAQTSVAAQPAAARGVKGPAKTPQPARPQQAERPQPVAAATPAAQPAPPPVAPQRTSRYGDAALYAALDLGTNNCRLLVAVPGRPGQFRVVDAFSRIVRLGEGLTATGRLSEAAMTRAVEALRICADKLAQRDIRRSRLIATEACRSAENGEEFIARVREHTGLELEIIDRETEARLAVSGCGTLVERETPAVVLFDIGGGSSEIALIDLSQRRTARLANHIAAWTSLPVGVVSLAERFGGRDVSRETFAAMIAYVRDLLEGFSGRDRLGALAAADGFHLLGTSGTVTTLAGVHLGLDRYDRRRVDGLWMDDGDVDAMVERLLGWDFAARVANPCIGADRADLVLAGCAILEAIRQVWPSRRLRVADRGLREGILTDLMGADGVWSRERRQNWKAGR